MRLPNTTVVYSAKHTGTWFAVDLLATNGGNTLGRSDEWLTEISDGEYRQWEATDFTMTKQGLLNFITKYPAAVKFINKHNLKQLTLQAHHKEHNIWTKKLLRGGVKLPIVVPVRNPLLAFNTTVWRTVGSVDKLQEQDEKTRRKRLAEVFSCISRVISIPSAYIVPIDRDDINDLATRIHICEGALVYAGLQPTDRTTEFARLWKPVNVSEQGHFPENTGERKTDNDTFKELKYHIVRGNMKPVKKVYSVEYGVLRRMAARYNLMKLFHGVGYKPFPWM